jgi:hypothetical protein
MYISSNNKEWQHTHCYHLKAICTTYSDSVSVFLPYLSSTQSTMRCILLSSVACLILPNIYISPHKWHNKKKKVKQSRYRPGMAQREVKVPKLHDNPYTALYTGRLYPQEMLLVLISVRGWVDPRAIVRSEGLCQWKITMTPTGIKPATFRFVAQYLNHCATTSGPHNWRNIQKKLLNIKCIFRLSLQLLSETFLILWIIQRDMIINVHRSPHELPVILVMF